MSSELFSLIMDCVVLTFLGATIFYAYRLSKSLQDFKAHRSEFDSVIANLIASIDKAERAIGTLKQTSAQETTELQRLIDQAKTLSGELTIINQASESMATRLENLAERNSKIARGEETTSARPTPPKQKATAKQRKADIPSFMIKDQDDSTPEDNEALQSEAEKELFAALKSNKRKVNKGGRKAS